MMDDETIDLRFLQPGGLQIPEILADVTFNPSGIDGRLANASPIFDGKAVTIRILANDTPDDIRRLRGLTETSARNRRFVIYVEDLVCPSCLDETYRAREVPKPRMKRWGSMVFDRTKESLHVGIKYYAINCTHVQKESNKVTRFFTELGFVNACRMRELILETKKDTAVDPDILASAVANIKRYFRHIDELSIHFRLEGVPLPRDTINRLVCSLRELESVLPESKRLLVTGLDPDKNFLKAWEKKRRPHD